MGNCLLAYPNRIDAATFSGGSWVDRTRLASRSLADVAETIDASTGATQCIIDLGASYTVRLVALLNHNCTSAATIKWDFGSTSGGTQLGTSGTVNVWRTAFDGVTRNFPSAYDSVIGYPYWAPYVLPADVSCRYIQFALTDTGHPLAKLRIGRIFVGAGLVPTWNFDIGAGIQPRDLTEVERAQGGAIYWQKRRRMLTAKIPLSHFDATERSKLMAIMRGAGAHDEIGFVPDISDMADAQEYGCVARLATPPDLPWSMPLKWSTELELEELL